MFLPSASIFWLRRREENSKGGRESLKSRRHSSSLQLNKLKKYCRSVRAAVLIMYEILSRYDYFLSISVTQPWVSGILPHWRPVRVLYSFMVSSPIPLFTDLSPR